MKPEGGGGNKCLEVTVVWAYCPPDFHAANKILHPITNLQVMPFLSTVIIIYSNFNLMF